MSIKIKNQIVNFFWTILCFAPFLLFWIGNGANQWLYAFLLISLGFAFLPEKVLNRMRLSDNKMFYEKIGVKIIRKFVQDGDYIQHNVSGSAKRNINSVKGMVNYLRTISMYERYHWCCFMFFIQTSVYGASQKTSIIIFMLLANFLYNICPILLQQYNKIRINDLLSRYNIFK